MKGRVLVIAGSDSGGGAGIQADIKSITALGGYAMTAITALTAQNTKGVFGVFGVDPAFIGKQIALCLDDIGADAIKTGMLNDAPVIEAVSDAIESHGRGLPLIVDPVMVAKGGERLLEDTAIDTLKRRLIVLSSVLTPNIPEAEALSGMTIEGPEDMPHAAEMLRTLGPDAVLLKGGHLPTSKIHDVLATDDGVEELVSERIDSKHTHGTGCTLASALATGLAQGLAMRDAVVRARDYVQEAIRSAPGYGQGQGPVNHGHTVAPFGAEAAASES